MVGLEIGLKVNEEGMAGLGVEVDSGEEGVEGVSEPGPTTDYTVQQDKNGKRCQWTIHHMRETGDWEDAESKKQGRNRNRNNRNQCKITGKEGR